MLEKLPGRTPSCRTHALGKKSCSKDFPSTNHTGTKDGYTHELISYNRRHTTGPFLQRIASNYSVSLLGAAGIGMVTLSLENITEVDYEKTCLLDDMSTE